MTQTAWRRPSKWVSAPAGSRPERVDLAASVGELTTVVSRLDIVANDPTVAARLERVGQRAAAAQAIESHAAAIAAIDGKLLDFVEREVPALRWGAFPPRE